jgi:hypothetical protein
LRSRHAVPALLFLLTALATSQTPTQFSGDLYTKTGREEMTGKLYFGGDKMRMDLNAQGQRMSMITDTKKQVVYMVMHDEKMYMEMPANARMPGGPPQPKVEAVDPNNPCAQEPGMECKKVGEEVVNGRNTDKWQASRKGKVEGTLWIDKKLSMPIKSVWGDVTTEMRNIVEGPQDPKLFVVPPGYQKFDMGGMTGGPRRQ